MLRIVMQKQIKKLNKKIKLSFTEKIKLKI
jgi:hypothetical protein